MLLVNRRHRLIFAFLAGMEVAWFLPFGLLLIERWQAVMAVNAPEQLVYLNRLARLSPLVLLLIFWALYLVYLLVADLLNTRLIFSPARELYLLAATIISTLLVIRIFLYPTLNPFDLSWIGHSFGAIFNYTSGWRPELVLMIINLFFWLRVVWNSDRDITFFGIGVSFRLGLLLALLSGGLLAALTPRDASISIQFFWLFFGLGLAAVALARIDEKALIGEQSAGRIMPWARLGQILLAVLITLGIGRLLTLLITPDRLLAFLGLFSPLWQLFGTILFYITYAILWALTPFIEWLIRMAQGALISLDIAQQGGEVEEVAPEEFVSINQLLQEHDYARYVLVGMVILGILLILFFFYAKRPRARLVDEEEVDDAGEVDLGGNALRRGIDRLRNLANLVRRFGLSNQLLDAISVENMYANLGRLARQRGFPRRIDQPPDAYLPDLCHAFPGQNTVLLRLTNAYMRVHYGDRAVEGEELAELRAAYERVREAPATQPTDQPSNHPPGRGDDAGDSDETTHEAMNPNAS